MINFTNNIWWQISNLKNKGDGQIFILVKKNLSKYKKNIIEDKIKEQLDKIAPFIGKDREYSFMDEEDNQYWRFHSMRRLDDKYFMIKLSDQFFNLFLKVKADLDKK